jgi:hypothetical protein
LVNTGILSQKDKQVKKEKAKVCQDVDKNNFKKFLYWKCMVMRKNQLDKKELTSSLSSPVQHHDHRQTPYFSLPGPSSAQLLA